MADKITIAEIRIATEKITKQLESLERKLKAHKKRVKKILTFTPDISVTKFSSKITLFTRELQKIGKTAKLEREKVEKALSNIKINNINKNSFKAMIDETGHLISEKYQSAIKAHLNFVIKEITRLQTRTMEEAVPDNLGNKIRAIVAEMRNLSIDTKIDKEMQKLTKYFEKLHKELKKELENVEKTAKKGFDIKMRYLDQYNRRYKEYNANTERLDRSRPEPRQATPRQAPTQRIRPSDVPQSTFRIDIRETEHNIESIRQLYKNLKTNVNEINLGLENQTQRMMSDYESEVEAGSRAVIEIVTNTHNKEIAEYRDFYNQKIALARANGQSTENLEREMNNTIQTLEQQHNTRVSVIERQANQQRQRINAENNRQARMTTEERFRREMELIVRSNREQGRFLRENQRRMRDAMRDFNNSIGRFHNDPLVLDSDSTINQIRDLRQILTTNSRELSAIMQRETRRMESNRVEEIQEGERNIQRALENSSERQISEMKNANKERTRIESRLAATRLQVHNREVRRRIQLARGNEEEIKRIEREAGRVRARIRRDFQERRTEIEEQTNQAIIRAREQHNRRLSALSRTSQRRQADAPNERQVGRLGSTNIFSNFSQEGMQALGPLTGQLGGLGQALSRIHPAALIAVAGLGLVSLAIKKGIKQYLEYEKSVQRVSTLLNETQTEGLKMAMGGLRDISQNTGFTIDELSDSLYNVISAIPSLANNLNAATSIVDKAAKAGTALGASTNDVTLAMAKFGNAMGINMEIAENQNFVLDAMANTMKLGLIPSGQELSKYFATAAPTISVLTKNTKHGTLALGSMTAVLTGAGVEMSIAQTQMKALSNQLLDSSVKAKLFKAGFEGLDSKGLVTDWRKFVKSLSENADSIDQIFSNVRAKNALRIMAKDSGKAFLETFEKMEDGAGTANEMFEKMANTGSGEIEKLQAKWNDLLLTIGESASDYFIGFTKGLNSVLGEITSWFEPAYQTYQRLDKEYDKLTKNMIRMNEVSESIDLTLTVDSASENDILFYYEKVKSLLIETENTGTIAGKAINKILSDPTQVTIEGLEKVNELLKGIKAETGAGIIINIDENLEAAADVFWDEMYDRSVLFVPAHGEAYETGTLDLSSTKHRDLWGNDERGLARGLARGISSSLNTEFDKQIKLIEARFRKTDFKINIEPEADMSSIEKAEAIYMSYMDNIREYTDTTPIEEQNIAYLEKMKKEQDEWEKVFTDLTNDYNHFTKSVETLSKEASSNILAFNESMKIEMTETEYLEEVKRRIIKSLDIDLDELADTGSLEHFYDLILETAKRTKGMIPEESKENLTTFARDLNRISESLTLLNTGIDELNNTEIQEKQFDYGSFGLPEAPETDMGVPEQFMSALPEQVSSVADPSELESYNEKILEIHDNLQSLVEKNSDMSSSQIIDLMKSADGQTDLIELQRTYIGMLSESHLQEMQNLADEKLAKDEIKQSDLDLINQNIYAKMQEIQINTENKLSNYEILESLRQQLDYEKASVLMKRQKGELTEDEANKQLKSIKLMDSLLGLEMQDIRIKKIRGDAQADLNKLEIQENMISKIATEIAEVKLKQDDASLEREIEYLKGLKKINNATIKVLKSEIARAEKYGITFAAAEDLITKAKKEKTRQENEHQKALKGTHGALIDQGKRELAGITLIRNEIANLEKTNVAIDKMISDRESAMGALSGGTGYKGGTGSSRMRGSRQDKEKSDLDKKAKDDAKELQDYLKKVADAVARNKKIDDDLQKKLSDLAKKQKQDELKEQYNRIKAERAFAEKLRKVEEKRIEAEYSFIDKLISMISKIREKTIGYAESSSGKLLTILDKFRVPDFAEKFNRSVDTQLEEIEDYRINAEQAEQERLNNIASLERQQASRQAEAERYVLYREVYSVVTPLLQSIEEMEAAISAHNEALRAHQTNIGTLESTNTIARAVGQIDTSHIPESDMTSELKAQIQDLNDLLAKTTGRDPDWVTKIRELLEELLPMFPEIRAFGEKKFGGTSTPQRREGDDFEKNIDRWLSVLAKGDKRRAEAWEFIDLDDWQKAASKLFESLKPPEGSTTQTSAELAANTAEIANLNTSIRDEKDNIRNLENEIDRLLREVNTKLRELGANNYVERQRNSLLTSEAANDLTNYSNKIRELGIQIDESGNAILQKNTELEALKQENISALPIVQMSLLSEVYGSGISELEGMLTDLEKQFHETFEADYMAKFHRDFGLVKREFSMFEKTISQSKIQAKIGEHLIKINENIESLELEGTDSLVSILNSRITELMEAGASEEMINAVREKIRNIQEDSSGLLGEQYLEEEIKLLKEQRSSLKESSWELSNLISRIKELGKTKDAYITEDDDYDISDKEVSNLDNFLRKLEEGKIAVGEIDYSIVSEVGWTRFIEHLNLAESSIADINKMKIAISGDVKEAYEHVSKLVEVGEKFEEAGKPELATDDYIAKLKAQLSANLELAKRYEGAALSGNKEATVRIKKLLEENDKINILISNYEKYKNSIEKSTGITDSLKEIDDAISELQYKESMGHIKTSERLKKEIELLKEKAKLQKGESYTKTVREIKKKEKEVDSSEKAEQKDSIDSVTGGLNEIDSAMNLIEDAIGRIKEISELFSEDKGGEALAAIGDLTSEIGKALLKAPYPFNVIGAFILGVGLIQKLMGKIAAMFKPYEESALEIAEERARVQMRILESYKNQVDMLSKLNELGEESVNNAWKLYQANLANYNLKLQENALFAKYANMTSKERLDEINNLKEQKSDLDDALAVLDKAKDMGYTERTDYLDANEDLLSPYIDLSDYKGSNIFDTGYNKSDIDDMRDIIKTNLTDTEKELGTAEDVDVFFNDLLAQYDNAVEELQDLFNLKFDLIADLRITDGSMVEAANDLKEFRKSELLDALYEIKPEFDWSGLSDEELKQTVLDIISGVSDLEDFEFLELGDEDLELFKEWVATFETAEQALSSLYDSELNIIDLRSKINPDDKDYLSELDAAEKTLETLQDQLAAAYEIEASDEYILSIKAKIYEWEQKINELKKDSKDVTDAEVLALVRLRNELIRRANLSGGMDASERARLQSVNDRIRDKLTALGMDSQEIDRIMSSMGLPTAHTGLWVPGSGEKPYLLEGGERVVSNKEVNNIGKKMLDSFIAGGQQPSSAKILNFSQANSQVIENVNIATVQDASEVWKQLEPKINENWKNNIALYERSKNKYVV